MDALYQLLKNRSTPFKLTAQGRSMWPAIKPGDQLEIVPCRPESLGIGEIVAIYRGGALTCHRLVARWRLGKSYLFFEKGDNQRYGQLLRPRAIIGKVITLNSQPLPPAPLPLTDAQQGGLILKSWLAFTMLRGQELIRQRFRQSSSRPASK